MRHRDLEQFETWQPLQLETEDNKSPHNLRCGEQLLKIITSDSDFAVAVENCCFDWLWLITVSTLVLFPWLPIPCSDSLFLFFLFVWLMSLFTWPILTRTSCGSFKNVFNVGRTRSTIFSVIPGKVSDKTSTAWLFNFFLYTQDKEAKYCNILIRNSSSLFQLFWKFTSIIHFQTKFMLINLCVQRCEALQSLTVKWM